MHTHTFSLQAAEADALLSEYTPKASPLPITHCAHTHHHQPHPHSLQAAEADALLSKYTPKSGAGTCPINAARPTLLRAQLALEAGNVGAALALMQQGLPAELTMKPAVVATRVALLEQVRVRGGGGMGVCGGVQVGCVACLCVG